jgi:hypothetical protein
LRKSCFVQLVLVALLVVALAMTLRRYLLPSPEAPEEVGVVSQSLVEEGEPSPRADPGLRLFGAAMPTPRAQESSVSEGAGTPVPTGIEGLALELSRPLMIEVPRISGLAADAASFYVSSFDPTRGSGLVLQVSRSSHTIRQVRALSEAGRGQLGAMQRGRELAWVPLFRDGVGESGLVVGLDPGTLETRWRIEAGIALRAVAEGADGRLYGLGADSLRFHTWSADGTFLGSASVTTNAEYADMEAVRGSLVCAGHDAQSGVLDVLDAETLSLLVRHRCHARADDGGWVTDGGFAVEGSTFFFLPGQGKFPMLLSYALDGVALEAYIPTPGA